jgi:hypothetical protein
MTEGEQEPFAESNPVYQDLVNIDFPQVQEYRAEHSLWDRYQRQDFRPQISAAERIHHSLRSLTFVEVSLIRVFLLLGAAALLVGDNVGLIDQLSETLGVPVQNARSALTVFPWVCFSVLPIVAIYALSNPLSIQPKVIRSAPVETSDLAIKTRIRVAVDILFSFIELMLFLLRVPFSDALVSAVRKALELDGRVKGAFVRPIMRPGDLNQFRPIWLGNGQLQFGCGPKGVLVHYDDGPLFLLGWRKVQCVYDVDGEFDWKVTGPDGAEVDLSELLPEDERQPPDSEPGWARSSIRLRLRRANELDPIDELVVPKRFFGNIAGAVTWQDFMRACLLYKHFPQDTPGSGKSVGSISFPEPRTQITFCDSLGRWRQGGTLAASA